MHEQAILQTEETNIQERITYHNQLLAQKAQLEELIRQNEIAILKLEGRISMLKDLLGEHNILHNNKDNGE